MKIMKKSLLMAAIATMMAMTGCTGGEIFTPDVPLNNDHNELRAISLTRAEEELVNSNNEFAFNLFRIAGPRNPAARDGSPEKSVILSPISITYALGMLNNGATGET